MKPRLKNIQDSCLCLREHTEYRSLTNRSIVWHSLQFLHNINVQQLKGEQILQEKTHSSFHEQTLKLNHSCTWQHRSHWCTNNTLPPQGAVFPQHTFTSLNMVHKSGQGTKLRTPLSGPEKDSMLTLS